MGGEGRGQAEAGSEETESNEGGEEQVPAGTRSVGAPEFGGQAREYRKKVDENVSLLSEEELQRYGTFRRTVFNKGGIRRFVAQTLGQTCNPNFTIVLSGIAKVFVGEILEEAKAVQSEWGDRGDLMPSHIHESYRRLCHRIPNMSVDRG
jgi:transcription initiation factor TFIID subunit 11